jgi:hypothetical protein
MPPLASFEVALLPGSLRAGKGSGFIAEKFAFRKIFLNGGAVDLYAGFVFFLRCSYRSAPGPFPFPRRFSLQNNVAVVLRDILHFTYQRFRCGAAVNEIFRLP